jgi:hypothetical protein
MQEAIIDSMLKGSCSWWVVSLRMSSSKVAIESVSYSSGPIHSIPPSCRFTTGRTNLATCEDRKIPGKK